MRKTPFAVGLAILVLTTVLFANAAFADGGFFQRWNPMRLFRAAPAKSTPEQRLQRIRTKLDERGLPQPAIDRRMQDLSQTGARSRSSTSNSAGTEVTPESRVGGGEFARRDMEESRRNGIPDVLGPPVAVDAGGSGDGGGRPPRMLRTASNVISQVYEILPTRTEGGEFADRDLQESRGRSAPGMLGPPTRVAIGEASKHEHAASNGSTPDARVGGGEFAERDMEESRAQGIPDVLAPPAPGSSQPLPSRYRFRRVRDRR